MARPTPNKNLKTSGETRQVASLSGDTTLGSSISIVQVGHKCLRDVSKIVPRNELGSGMIKVLLERMHATLNTCPDGVALAAPQIGVNLRLFVVSPKAFGSYNSKKDQLVYINPTIQKRSAKKVLLEEGCLSVRNVYGQIERNEKVTIRAIDQDGNGFTRGASGLLAEIFQHEIDHLDGKLFIDTATNLHEL